IDLSPRHGYARPRLHVRALSVGGCSTPTLLERRRAPSMRRTGLTHVGVAALLMIGSWTAAGTLPAAASDTGTAASATTSSPTGSESASAGLLDAMQRDFGLTRTEAEAQLTAERRAADAVPEAREAAGSAYGGAWFDGRSRKLTVAVTAEAGASTVEAVRSTGAAVRTVEHSARALDAAKSRIDRLDAPAGVSSWSVDPAANTVVVNVVSTKKSDNDVRSFVAKAREAGPVT